MRRKRLVIAKILQEVTLEFVGKIIKEIYPALTQVGSKIVTVQAVKIILIYETIWRKV